MTITELISNLLVNTGFKNPRTEKITVRVYERDNNEDVIGVTEYPISWIRGADGRNAICVEHDYGRPVGKSIWELS